MSQTAYERGYRFEDRVRKHLEGQGWYVIRSGGSKKAADLIAGRGGEIMLIQCKTDGIISTNERQQLKAVAAEFGGTPMLAYRQGCKLIMEVT